MSRERDRGTCTCCWPDRRATLLKELTRAADTASVRIQEVIEPCARKTGREVADASRGWKFTRKSALRTWHAHVALRKSSTASSAEVASVVDRARLGNGHEKLQHRVGFDGLRFDDESGPRADAASRKRRPSRKVRMQSVDLHYQTHGNDVHRASCASQSVELRYQTRGNALPSRKLRFAECEPA